MGYHRGTRTAQQELDGLQAGRAAIRETPKAAPSSEAIAALLEDLRWCGEEACYDYAPGPAQRIYCQNCVEDRAGHIAKRAYDALGLLQSSTKGLERLAADLDKTEFLRSFSYLTRNIDADENAKAVMREALRYLNAFRALAHEGGSEQMAGDPMTQEAIAETWFENVMTALDQSIGCNRVTDHHSDLWCYWNPQAGEPCDSCRWLHDRLVRDATRSLLHVAWNGGAARKDDRA